MLSICSGKNNIDSRGRKNHGRRLIKVDTFDLGITIGKMAEGVPLIFGNNIDLGV